MFLSTDWLASRPELALNLMYWNLPHIAITKMYCNRIVGTKCRWTPVTGSLEHLAKK
jgi:hypothetical protein